MAQFTREQLVNTVDPDEAWGVITDALKSGFKSVEVLSRVVDGDDVWEVRVWDGIRADRSNSARASSQADY
ncbi:MAG: hypothetical protein ACR2NU_15720 [Aeoliella sp.]